MAPGAEGRSVFARCIMLLLPCTTYATPHALLHTANICYVMHLKRNLLPLVCVPLLDPIV
ncbi:hypothetical protein OH76DRAFT_1407604 [Lentinus brumalis]|uniref:Uncharacterized protein n=1 Tax=Lentinus brumalis TaxID=2498619 RepID=A0A371CZV9_9APHY|nr:hypothetical protein OH76DRAFT_1407604 [Polyporus brumalis]